MGVIASTATVFAVIFLITRCAALDNGCTCTPNTNDTTTRTLSTPGLPSCERQWMDENNTVLTYNEDFGPGVLSLTPSSIITKGCQKKLKYSVHCTHLQDLREVVCLCDCHGHSKKNVQSGEEGDNKTNVQSGEEGDNKTNVQSDLGRYKLLVLCPFLLFIILVIGCITAMWMLNRRKVPGQEKNYQHV